MSVRLTKIHFSNFKRLRHTGCSAAGKVVAFLGPNEAGKSSVLQGLDWLSDRTGDVIPDDFRSRVLGGDQSDTVVTAWFSVETSDLDSAEVSRRLQKPTELKLWKHADGRRMFVLTPQPTRPSEPFDAALSAAKNVKAQASDSVIEMGESELATLDELIVELQRPNRATSMQWNDGLDELESDASEGLLEDNSEELPNAAGGDASAALRELGIRLGDLRQELAKPEPHLELGTALLKNSPEFILFEDADRELRSSYDLGSSEVVNGPPRALANLLDVAGTTAAELLAIQQRGRITEVQTQEKRCNEKLKAVLDETWGQSNLSVRINIDGRNLQLLIEERDVGGGLVSLAERSDGLRVYVAMMCFLATRHANHPVILLIDEAETHLHVDAQADLVRTFYQMRSVSQVLYTTHSPACLPTDLGTGVRFVKPDRVDSETSALCNNFWTEGIPGYSPLLYAMGAGAAAFSACRFAVVSEGAADMILLPTLLKSATGIDQLAYQIAPGLSNIRPDQVPETESVGANVVYLLDGDGGGRDLRALLLREGVSEDRIVSLPSGVASEDFLDPDRYLSIVASIMKPSPDTPVFPDPSSLKAGETISRRLEIWAVENDVKIPGKVAVASAIVEKFSPDAIPDQRAGELRDLHAAIMRGLKLSN